MDPFLCTACGTQYTPSNVAPRQCAICEEERQYVPPRGQTWTTLGALAAGHFMVALCKKEPHGEAGLEGPSKRYCKALKRPLQLAV
jgi:hypothetical protein